MDDDESGIKVGDGVGLHKGEDLRGYLYGGAVNLSDWGFEPL